MNLKSELKNLINENLKAGGEVNVVRHRERNKKLARERIEEILDEGSPFIELSQFAGELVRRDRGSIWRCRHRVGKVHGIDCMFVADATVKGGTYFPSPSKSI